MNASNSMGIESLRRDAENIVGDAKVLLSNIVSARRPEDIRAFIAQLQGLANLPAVAASGGTVRTIIDSAAALGEAICMQLESSLAADSITYASGFSPIDRSQERLASYLDEKGLFLKGEKEYLERIDPNAMRTIKDMGTDGVIRGDKQVDGAQLRESMAILAAYSNLDTLDAQGRKELNRMLYGNENGPQNEKERQRGEERLKQAILDVEGDAAAVAKDPQKAAEAAERAKRDIKKLERVEELERKRDSVKHIPGMDKATQQALDDARKDAVDSIRQSRRKRIADVTDAQPQQDRTVAAAADANPAKPAPQKAAEPEASKADLGQLPPPPMLTAAKPNGASPSLPG